MNFYSQMLKNEFFKQKKGAHIRTLENQKKCILFYDVFRNHKTQLFNKTNQRLKLHIFLNELNRRRKIWKQIFHGILNKIKSFLWVSNEKNYIWQRKKYTKNKNITKKNGFIFSSKHEHQTRIWRAIMLFDERILH